MAIISAVLIILSSYIFSLVFSIQEKGRGNTFFLKFLLCAFSQIVLSFEILSLFKAISIKGVLICNVLFLAAAAASAAKFSAKTALIEVFENLKKSCTLIFKALKRDKALMVSFVCFVFFILFQLINIAFLPILYGDAYTYYFPRCTAWIFNGSISHYTAPDTRELIMPVNMDLLYTWLMLFTKSERGAAIFSFLGYSGMIYVLFNLLRELNFSIRRSLWAVFVFSSFALVVIETALPCADLFTGALILGSIYLFIKSVKYSDKTALYFSALSAALAAGVKTTALIAAPSVFLIFCFLCMQNKKMRFKPLLIFSGLFIINFLIFSSYNYILNFIDFNNPFSDVSQMLIHQFRGGFAGWRANAAKYFYAFFDMSGMPSFININPLIEYSQKVIFSAAGIDINAGTSGWFPGVYIFHNNMRAYYSLTGAMGISAFIPSIFYALKVLYRKKVSNRASILGILALSIILNILLLAGVMVFADYNMRYLLTFICIAAPAVVYSYPVKNKLYKCFLCLLIFNYLVLNTFLKPVLYIAECINRKSIAKIETHHEEQDIYALLKDKKPACAALIISQTQLYAFYIETLRFEGTKIEKLLPEIIENYDLKKYDYIIAQKFPAVSVYAHNYEDRLQNPDNYASKCTYFDSSKNVIYKSAKDIIPVMSECSIPYEYIKNQGFYMTAEFPHYIIFKRAD